jgi:hypothetical protein
LRQAKFIHHSSQGRSSRKEGNSKMTRARWPNGSAISLVASFKGMGKKVLWDPAIGVADDNNIVVAAFTDSALRSQR